MSAYVKVKFVLIRVMVGELCAYTQTIGPSDNDERGSDDTAVC